MRLPPAALVDTSVLLRLFHDHDDPQQRAADAIREAFADARMELVLLDLSIYEFVNVLVRSLRRSGGDAAGDVEALFDLDVPVVSVDRELARAAAILAAETGLTGYDAAFVAAADGVAVPLITADQRIIERARKSEVIPLSALAD